MSFDIERYDSSLPRPVDTTAGSDLRGPSTSGSGHDDETRRRLDAALHSPYGIEKLLNRLKQSIFSAREFSGFLKERASLEDRYAQGYKKLVRHALDSIQRPESRQGSYARSFSESLRLNERLAENGLQHASSLQAMSDELREMAESAERGRKHWKHTTIDAEKRVADSEAAQAKAKERYNNAAEQYDRVRAGEKAGGKFGLKKGNSAQQEEALKEKADMLDQDYTAKTRAAQEQRREHEATTRPQIVRNLQDQINECDAHLAMQMAKLASLSEKHIVSNGMAIAPMKGVDSTGPEPRGLRHIAQGIDNTNDFHDYMLDGVEPPPQFKGRSRRNTDAELNNPMQSTPNFQSRQSFDAPPYSGPQSQADSFAPQLPQIGGDDSFGKSFEMQRPNNQKENSYFGGQSQQTGITQEPTPSTSAGRGMPSMPNLPSYDRSQATAGAGYEDAAKRASTGPGGFDQNGSQGPSTIRGLSLHERDQGAPSHDFLVQGPERGPQIAAGGNATERNQTPPRQDSMGPGTGQDHTPTSAFSGPHVGPGLPAPGSAGAVSGRENPYAATTATGRGQPMIPGINHVDRSQGPARPDYTAQDSERGQSPTSSPSGPYAGRGGPAPGSYLDTSRGPAPGIAGAATGRENPYAASAASGRGQQIVSQPSYDDYSRGPAPGTAGAATGRENPYAATTAAGRGQQPSAQRNLPSQQPPRPALPPNNPVFGMHLDELFRRDGSAVPAIVFQCIQAVDSFGLHNEGIYRVSGSSPTVMQLKSEFDHGKTNCLLQREHELANILQTQVS